MSLLSYKLVLLRHGHSEWNLSNRFTGWTDIALTQIGLEEASKCGNVLADQGFQFDEVHHSSLQRTKQTADKLLQAAAHQFVPYFCHWRLNERHYGRLQGMNKNDIFAQWGEQQAQRWWRGYSESPPPLDVDDPRHPRFDDLYRDIDPKQLPGAESLQQCQQRTLDYWHKHITPKVLAGKRLLVITHGNTLRAIRMHVESITPEDIECVEIPSAAPMVYHFNPDMKLHEIEWLHEKSPSVV